jgi:hypothetical protein
VLVAISNPPSFFVYNANKWGCHMGRLPPVGLIFVIPVPVLAQSLGLAIFVSFLAVYPILFLWSALFDISHVVATLPFSLHLLWEVGSCVSVVLVGI